MINTNDASASPERKIFTFRIGDQVLGIDMAALTEIREGEEPTPLPGTSRYVRGVTNLRGTVVPIVDLSERLGWERTKVHARSCIVVVRTCGALAGFLVDQVADIVPVLESAIQPPPSLDTIEDGIVAGLVQVSSTAGTVKAAEEKAATTVALLNLDALNVVQQMEDAAAAADREAA